MTVISEFFDREFDLHAYRLLSESLTDMAPTYLTFNIFNVRLDPARGTATVEDELEADRQETISLKDFRRLVDLNRPPQL